MDEVPCGWADATPYPCTLRAGHAGAHWCAPDLAALTARAAAAEALAGDALRLLDRLYPALAGRVIQLEQAGEPLQASAWDADARAVHALIARPDVRALLEGGMDDR